MPSSSSFELTYEEGLREIDAFYDSNKTSRNSRISGISTGSSSYLHRVSSEPDANKENDFTEMTSYQEQSSDSKRSKNSNRNFPAASSSPILGQLTNTVQRASRGARISLLEEMITEDDEKFEVALPMEPKTLFRTQEYLAPRLGQAVNSLTELHIPTAPRRSARVDHAVQIIDPTVSEGCEKQNFQ